MSVLTGQPQPALSVQASTAMALNVISSLRLLTALSIGG
jgi:hypothetical protein